MPRSLTISLPADPAGRLVDELSELEGVLAISRQPHASIRPPGDVVTVEVLNRSIPSLFALLSRYGAGTDDGVSVSTSEPTAVVSASSPEGLARDPSTTSFEEVEATLEKESTMGANKVAAMAAAGAIAAVGLLTNSLHLVIGAMLIAPGFEPFLKVAFRATGRSRSFRRGFFDIGAGWSALVLGAAAAAVVLRVVGVSLESPTGGYFPPGALVPYWREWTPSAMVVALVASVAGTVLVVAGRAVLTGGVMIALALVPGATLVGIALIHADPLLAVQGALRWAQDAVTVTLTGAAVFALYRLRRGRGLGDR